ncbi:MAG: hypothetical protein ACRCVN_01190, partial [Spirochaetia bacterium]
MKFKYLMILAFFLSLCLEQSFAQAATMRPYFGKTFLGKTSDSIPLIFVFNHNGALVQTASGGQLHFFKEIFGINIYKAGHGAHEHYYGFKVRDEKSLFFSVLDNDLQEHNSQVTLTKQSLEKKMQERGIVLVQR